MWKFKSRGQAPNQALNTDTRQLRRSVPYVRFGSLE